MSEDDERNDLWPSIARSVAGWGLVVSLLIALYDIALIAEWPFPNALDSLRGPFYVLAGILLLAAALFITFVGYRMVSLRVVRQSRLLYPIFLPGVVLLASIVGFLLLITPR